MNITDCKMCGAISNGFDYCWTCDHKKYLGFKINCLHTRNSDIIYYCGKCNKHLKSGAFPLCFKCNKSETISPSIQNIVQKPPRVKLDVDSYLFD